MQNVVAELIAKLGLDISGYKEGVEEATRESDKLGDKLEDTAKGPAKDLSDKLTNIGESSSGLAEKFGPLLLGLTSIGAAIGLAALAASKAATQFLDFSRRIEGLSEMSGAGARETSTLVSALDSIGVTSSVSERAIMKFSLAAVEGNKSLDHLRISTREASGEVKTGTQIFYEVVDALGSMTSELDRNKIAYDLFGESWLKIVKAAGEGSGALRELGKSTGMVLTDKDLKAAQDYEKAIQQFGKTWNEFVLTIGPKVISVLTAIIELMGKVTSGGGGKGGWKPFEGTMEEAARKALPGLYREKPTTYETYGVYDDPSLHGGGYISRFATPPPTNKSKEGTDPYYVAAKARLEFDERMNAEIAKYSMKFYEDEEKRMLDAEKFAETVREGVLKNIETQKAEEQKLYIDNAKIELDVEKINAQDMKETWDVYFKWKAEQTKISIDEIAKLETEAEAKRDLDLSIAQSETAKVEAQFETLFSSIGRAFTTAFDGVIQGTQTVSDAFRRMGQSILLTISDTIINQGLKQLQESLWKVLSPYIQQGLGGLLSSISSSGSSVDTAAWATSSGAASSSFVGFAEGGVVTRPTMSLVGEGGETEAIVPLSRAGEFGFGGGGVTQNLFVNTGVPETVRREINAMRPQLQQDAIDAMLEARNRGGIVAKSFGSRNR